MTSKLTLPALTIAVLMACAVANAADTGTITFTGAITDTPCTVATSSVTQSIPLGTISDTALSGGAGKVARPIDFAIVIDNCPDDSDISINFSGNADSVNPTLLALDSGSAASGFGIGLFESDGTTAIDPRNNSSSQSVPTTGATLNFVAKLISTGPISPGAYTATTNFTLVYN